MHIKFREHEDDSHNLKRPLDDDNNSNEKKRRRIDNEPTWPNSSSNPHLEQALLYLPNVNNKRRLLHAKFKDLE
ncbi:urea transporter [Acrasis kona]|uniref:Urea transporter n=1 Tax=Acrasis kona TaxID=1008807 RepID=A0AAW2ZEV4_9EUKA